MEEDNNISEIYCDEGMSVEHETFEEHDGKKITVTLSKKEERRFQERLKREALEKAGKSFWDIVTGRHYFDRGIDAPYAPKVNKGRGFHTRGRERSTPSE